MTLLDMRDLVVTYQTPGRPPVTAVAGAGLSVERGQIVGLVGESGCGKSTLGKAAVGLLAPSSGTVVFDGTPVAPLTRRARPVAQRRLQMIFQDPFSSLNPRRSVGEQINDGLRLAGHRRDAGRVRELLERVALPVDAAGRYPHEFSGGQRQRIAIARALAAEPSCIVADEPISALDASAQASVATLLVDLARELDMGLLFISHDLAIVRQIADVTTVMYLGTIAEHGPTHELWARPRHPYTRALIDAVPRPDGSGRLPEPLPGDVPDPAAPPSGCRFHPRCPLALPECAVRVPERVEIAPGHSVACPVVKEPLTISLRPVP
ncbi:ABC transporter ATP-binding protein [Streptosporangium sp. NPDC023615]|uniref:ABC transporter ATP-binding protein n=1 Tax=Streptosporangium sp. NPDC023615 TaxID=3154794 RepID=UPI00342F08D3